MRRVNFNGTSLVAALCLFPICCAAQSGSIIASLRIQPDGQAVSQGDAFTVNWVPFNNNIRTPSPPQFPLTVTLVPEPPSQLTTIITTFAAFEPSESPSVVIAVPPNESAGIVTLTVKTNGNIINEATNNPFSISIIPTPTTASSDLSTSEASTNPATTAVSTSEITNSSMVTPSTSLSTGDSDSQESNTPTGHTSLSGDSPSATRTASTSNPSLSLGSSTAIPVSETTSVTVQTTRTGEPSHGLSGGKISGIIIGLLIFLVILLLFCWRHKFQFHRARTPVLRVDHNSFGQLMMEKSFPIGHNPDKNTKLPESSRGSSTSNFFDDNHQAGIRPGVLEAETFSNLSSGSVLPQYTADVAITPVEKQSYGNQNLEELQEQRKKMHDLIDVLRERQRRVSGATLTNVGRIGNLEMAPL